MSCHSCQIPRNEFLCVWEIHSCIICTVLDGSYSNHRGSLTRLRVGLSAGGSNATRSAFYSVRSEQPIAVISTAYDGNIFIFCNYFFICLLQRWTPYSLLVHKCMPICSDRSMEVGISALMRLHYKCRVQSAMQNTVKKQCKHKSAIISTKTK